MYTYLLALVGAFTTLLMSSQILAADNRLIFYSSLDLHVFSEPTSVKSFLDDFSGELRPGESVFTTNRAEAGLRYGNWSLGYIQRYDYFLHLGEDLLQAYYASRHNQTASADRFVAADLQADHIRGAGPKIGFQFSPHSTLSLSFGLTQLTADQLVQGETNGTIRLLANGDFSGGLGMHVYSTEDLLLEKQVPNPQGKGLTMDFGFDWRPTSHWQLSMNILDVYSRIRWDNVLFSDLTANTETVNFDSNGNLSTSPVLFGYQYLTSFDQSLPVKYRARLHYHQSDRHGFYLEQFHVPDYVDQTIGGYQYSLSPSLAFGGYMNIDTRAVGLVLASRWLDLSIGFDRSSEDEAHAVDIALGLRVPLTW